MYVFANTVEAIERAGLRASDFVWFDLCMNNQWGTAARPFGWWTGTFQEAVQRIGHTLLVLTPWAAPVVFTRSWCLFEIYATCSADARLSVQMPGAEANSFRAVLGDQFEAIAASLSAVSLANASAFSAEDQARILRAAESAPGGVDRLDQLVLQALRGWLCDTALGFLRSAWRPGWSLTNQVALLLKTLGRLEEAEPLSKQALGGAERALGASHELTLIVRTNRALLLEDSGRLADAEPLLRNVLEQRTRALGADHADSLRAAHNLAVLLGARGKPGEAEPLLRRALEGRQALLGPEHPDTLQSANSAGLALRTLGRLDEAEPLLRRCVRGFTHLHGARHPATLAASNNLALLLKSRGALGEAEELMRRVLGAREAVLGADHPDTLTALNNLGALLKERGKLGEAEALYRRTLDASERTLGPTHPDTLLLVGNLAVLLEARQRLDEAKSLYERAVAGREAQLGADHPDTLTSVSNFAIFLDECMQDYARAEALYRRVARGMVAAHGPKSESAHEAQMNLDIFLREQEGRRRTGT